MIKYNALDPKLVLVQDRTGSKQGWRRLLAAEGFSCSEFAYAFYFRFLEFGSGDEEIEWMLLKEIQRIGPKLMLDTVGKAGRTDEMQRHSPIQTDAQEPVEAGKVIHVSVRHKGMADAQELARRQRSQITEIE
jgi:hypothetical protein